MANTIEILIKAANEASGTFKDVETDAGNLGTALAGIGQVAMGIAAAGIAAVVGGLTLAISEAMGAQEIMGKLDVTLGNLGLAGTGAKESILDTATALQDVTRFSDDAAIAAQNMLLQMGVAISDLPDVTAVTADLAAAMGIDLTTAAQTVGRALADPTAAAGKLMRMGIVLTDEQQDLIKGFVEAGNMAGAQGVIMDTLAGKYGGAAIAAGETFAGQLDRLKNGFGNIMETIGMAVLPSLQLLADTLITALNSPEVQAAIASITKWLGENLPIAINWLITAVGTVANFFQTQLLPVFQSLIDNGPLMAGVLGVIALGFAVWAISAGAAAAATLIAAAPVLLAIAAIGAGIALLYTAWTENWGGIQEVVAAFWAAIQPSLQAIWDGIVLAFTAIQTFLTENWGQIQAVIMAVWLAIQGVIQVAMAIIQGIIQVVAALIQGDWAAAWDAIKLMFEGIWNGIVLFLTGIGAALWGVMDLALKAFGTNLTIALAAVALFFTTAFNDIVAWLLGLGATFANIGASIVNGILDGIKAGWQSVIDWVNQAVADLAATDASGGLGPRGGFGAPGWQAGGIVQGPIGAPRMELVHGGEMIVPWSQVANYNLTINSQATTENVAADFAMMRVLAGV